MIHGGVNSGQDLNEVFFWHAEPADAKKEQNPASEQPPSEQPRNLQQPHASIPDTAEAAPQGTSPGTALDRRPAQASVDAAAQPTARATTQEANAGDICWG